MIRLEDILCSTREEVARRRIAQPLSTHGSVEARGFEAALRASSRPAIIAEIKRRSPSRGAIREDLDPGRVARSYEHGGCTAISVLTDTPYFGGSLDDLRRARGEVSKPVLRKDFIVDPYQVAETAAVGADALLLIVAALEKTRLRELFQCSRESGLDVLVEVHDENELEIAVDLGASVIGVNNRNLKTMEVDASTSLRVAAKIPTTALAVCESGISRPDDVKRAWDAGYRAFLIGEALAASEDREELLRSFVEAVA